MKLVQTFSFLLFMHLMKKLIFNSECHYRNVSDVTMFLAKHFQSV